MSFFGRESVGKKILELCEAYGGVQRQVDDIYKYLGQDYAFVMLVSSKRTKRMRNNYIVCDDLSGFPKRPIKFLMAIGRL